MKPYFEQQDKVINNPIIVILLVEIAKQRGVHPDKLLNGSKLFWRDLTKPDLAISQTQFTKIILNTINIVNSPDITFLLGSRLFPTQLGQIGLALSNARNLQDMLRIIKCQQARLFPFMFVSEKRYKQTRYLIFNHSVGVESDKYHIFMCELLVSVIQSAIKWRIKSPFNLCIRFPYRKPDHIEQYQAYLNGEYRFTPHAKQPFVTSKVTSNVGLQIALTEELMLKPFDESNQVLKRSYLNQLEVKALPVGIIQLVLQTIATLYDHNGDVTLEKLAGKLEMSVATLKRKLALHNTSYQKSLDLYRQQQALFYLIDKNESNEKVAQALYFSDITNFRRSFKRWTGLTPNALKLAFDND